MMNLYSPIVFSVAALDRDINLVLIAHNGYVINVEQAPPVTADIHEDIHICCGPFGAGYYYAWLLGWSVWQRWLTKLFY
jgi:hypothetical protein